MSINIGQKSPELEVKKVNNAERAASYFKAGFNCAQSTCASCCELFNVDPELMLRVASAFGGGIGRMGETCGAVTGALMVIGLKYGMTKPEDQTAKLKTYEVANDFVARFKARHTYIKCKELMGCDVSTPEGAKYAKDNDLHSKVCTPFLKDAVEIVETIL